MVQTPPVAYRHVLGLRLDGAISFVCNKEGAIFLMPSSDLWAPLRCIHTNHVCAIVSRPHLVEKDSAGHVVQHREKQDKAGGGLFLLRGAGD